jgi:hypothetical protein
MNRRQALKSIGIAAALPLSSKELFALGRTAHAHVQAAGGSDRYIFQSLDVHETEILSTATELIIPETDTPGAKAALVNRFVDAVVDDAEEADRRSFLRGFEWMDARSRELFGDEFLKASPDQQAALLTILSSGKNTALEDQRGVEFFEAVKELTITGYYTSEVGTREELHLDGQLFFAEFRGCTHPVHGGAPPAPSSKKKP